MERKKGNNIVLVVLNLSTSPTIGTIRDALPEGDFTEAFTHRTEPLSTDVDLPGWGYRVYVKDTPPRPSRKIVNDKFDRNELPRCSEYSVVLQAP
jgi:hypothetical protein